MEFQEVRNQLDRILDDYEYIKEERPFLLDVYTTYVMMENLLKEMNDMGDLEGYDVEDIFERIARHNNINRNKS